TVADLASEAHARIQQDFAQLDPIVGVSRGMRSQGIPADVVTFDCIKSGKRIIVILHDEQPQQLQYQFARCDSDGTGSFQSLPLTEVTADTFYQWMRDYL
ncbi:MAG TPA: hypothetical protein VIS52_05615, partial [Motiliproteus sp.]